MSSIFVVRGICEGDRRITRCDMVRVMDWDQLIEYLGDVWEELWDAMIFKLKVAEMSVSLRPTFLPSFFGESRPLEIS